MSKVLVWFRQDLRCTDNRAFEFACNNYDVVIPIYILDQEVQPLGAAQKWWLHKSLTSLKIDLESKGLTLNLYEGNSEEIILDVIDKFQIDAICFSNCYEPSVIKRDNIIEGKLRQKGVDVHSHNTSLLNEPHHIKNKSGDYFKVFTPYWRHCIASLAVPEVGVVKRNNTSLAISNEKLECWNLLPQNPNWAANFDEYWSPGEAGAQKKLDYFIENHLNHYKDSRNVPNKNGTSGLSPHLHFGEISPAQIIRAVNKSKANKDSLDVFISEIGWREFSYYLLFHFPKLPTDNFKTDFDNFPWKHSESHLKAWQTGRTGYPIVDAGMRQLWQTGSMHNRVRMIVASFLVKNLLIDWRKGADWFFDTLLDADLASNSASWQWVAGSGADAAPYFRIFNPTLQSEKFDPEGAYIRQWVPELKNVSNKWIHKPSDALAIEIPIKLGIDYPRPIVDHDKTRKIALEAYKGLKN